MKRLQRVISSLLTLSLLMGICSSNMAYAGTAGTVSKEAVLSAGASIGEDYTPAETARQHLNFNREWKFQAKTITVENPSAPDFGGAAAPDFDDSEWADVGLPHSFSIPYNMETNFFVGYGMYRKDFQVPEEWLASGKRISIEFEGAFIETEVFVNGKAAGSHLGGYTGFTFDITDLLHVGENTIAVRVNNLWRPDQTPRGGDHQFSGGIYRDVYLNVTDPVHVAWYGTAVSTPALNNPGFDEDADGDGQIDYDYENIDETAYTPAEEIRENIAQKHSDVRVQTEVENDSDAAKTIVVKQEVVDVSDNTLVASFASEPVVVAANSTAIVDTKSDYIQNIKLWSPETPNLYRVYTTVYDGDGNAADLFDSPLGFRWVQFLKDAFFLNGEQTVLFGANAHQDHAGWGDAVTNEGFARDVQMVKDAGMNFIRGSHYPHDPAYSEACDETGVMLWSEVAFWGKGGSSPSDEDVYRTQSWNGGTYPQYEKDEARFEESCMRDLEAMIRIHRNHPSVIVWSMGNEVFFDSQIAKCKALVNKMRNYAHELDPTRKAAMGGVQRQNFDSLDVCDVAGYNGDGGSFDTHHMSSIASEYGSHTANRGESGDQFRPYFDHMQNGSNIYDYALKGNRSGLALWCAFHHGSVLGTGLAQMGFIDYSRLPLKAWYWFRETYTGVPAEFSIDGEADHLTLESSQDIIPNDGTADTHLIVTLRDADGNWVSQNKNVTLEVLDGPGVFPTGKTFTLKSGNTLRDGKGAIEFRSFYAGTTTILATAADLEPVEITIVTKDVTGDETGEEPDGFMESGSRDNTPKIEDPGTYGGGSFSANRPTFSSSGDAKLANDGDMATSWVAENAGSGEYWIQDLEQSPLLYKVKLSFDRDPYPYRLEVSGDKNGPWTEVVSYDADTVKNRPYEESLPGTYARFVRVVFTGVPEDAHAFLTEAAVYAVDSTKGPMPDEQPDLSYTTGSVYVSDLQPAKPITQGWAGKTPGIDVSIEGNPIRIAGTEYAKGLGLHANSEAIYELDGRYARFQAVIGIDDEVTGTGDAIYRVYATVGTGDDAKEQLIYETQISSGQAEKVDLSIRGVTKLRLVTDANGANSNDHTDWADAKLLGAVRNMTKADSDYIVSMSSSTQGLEAGKTFATYLSLKNNGSSNTYGASLALYNQEGKLVKLVQEENRLSKKADGLLTLKLSVPADAADGYEARLNLYDANTLELLAETVHFGMQNEEESLVVSVSAKRAALAAAEEESAWGKVDGEDDAVVKEGSWGNWPGSGSYMNTETYVGDSYPWQNASISYTFTGSQVAVGGKIDGSQVGADVYLDGELVDHINSSTSAQGGKNGYYEVWRSELLPYGTHTIKLVPTGKFSVDYFSYLTESPWSKIDGEDGGVEKTGTWGLWKDSKAYAGTETFVGDSYPWQDASISYTFTGIQVCVGAKVDGSQVGAKVYIDDVLQGVIYNKEDDKAKQGYKRVWVSPILEEGEHTIRLEPIGKFGLDYFESLKPGFGDLVEPPTVDLKGLLAQIADAQSRSEDAYTDDSWAVMQKALKAAEAVRDQAIPTQEAVDNAAAALAAAIAALVPYTAPSDAEQDAFLQSLADILRFIESDAAEQYKAAGIETLAKSFKEAYRLYVMAKPEQEAIVSMTSTLQSNLNALEKLEPEETEHVLQITFPVRSAQLSIEGKDLKLANLTGKYEAKVMSNDDVTLTFTPTVEGREFAGVTVNGEPVALTNTKSYTYTAKMPNADTALNFAFTVVNKQVLRTVIDIAEGLKGGGEYNAAVPSVQELFDAALAKAVTIEAQADASQKDIDNAWAKLLNVIQHLSFAKGDKTVLKEALDTAAALEQGDYTAESWAAYELVLAAAQEVYDDADAMDKEIQEAAADLNAAMIALVYRADWDLLNTVLAQAEEIEKVLEDEYLPVGQEAFRKALNAARELDADASQKEINAAAETLTKAMMVLQRIPNKEALKDLLGETENLNLDKYTASSAKQFRSVRNAALAVANDPDATEQDVAAAYKNLLAAKAALEAKQPAVAKRGGSATKLADNTYGASGRVLVNSTAAYVRSDATGALTLKRGQSAVFQMTVINGNGFTPAFTVGNGSVLKTQAVSRIGNLYVYKVWAVGAPGESTGVYTTLSGNAPQKHVTVTVI